jgi:8-oxo-dGTP pyrophosphatase MutT (NUDIX family)
MKYRMNDMTGNADPLFQRGEPHEVSELELRVRRALAATTDQPPRPVSRLELPPAMSKLLLLPLIGSLRPAAVLVALMRHADGPTVLLTRRAEHLRSHKGQISFPGGGRDSADASIAANALREAQEEVGLNPETVEVVGYLDDYPTITRYRVTPVVGVVGDVPELQADADEVAEIFEVPLSFVLEPANFERKILTRSGVNVPFFELNYAGHRIWGATAGMLWNLAEKVAASG